MTSAVAAHTQENDPARFTSILKGPEQLAREYHMPVIYPIHPGSHKRMQEWGLYTNGNIRLMEPVDYPGFLQLESEAGLVLTDSGGLQEEACIPGVPCVMLQDDTIDQYEKNRRYTHPLTSLGQNRLFF